MMLLMIQVTPPVMIFLPEMVPIQSLGARAMIGCLARAMMTISMAAQATTSCLVTTAMTRLPAVLATTHSLAESELTSSTAVQAMTTLQTTTFRKMSHLMLVMATTASQFAIVLSPARSTWRVTMLKTSMQHYCKQTPFLMAPVSPGSTF